MQEVLGAEARWSDGEYLSALLVDRVGYLAWMFARANFKDIPRRPPKPITRPGDIAAAAGEDASVNLQERQQVTSGSLSLEEMDRVIEKQTGAPRGIQVIEAHEAGEVND